MPVICQLIVFPLLVIFSYGLSEKKNEDSVCMRVEHFHRGDDSVSFLECSPFTDADLKKFNLTEKYLGVWTKRKCPKMFEFSKVSQRCEEKKKRRRQQAACTVNQNSVGCHQSCHASNRNPQNGGQCDWLTSNLQPDSTSSSHFLQCAPQSAGQACGQWSQMPCSPGTNFNPSSQICVPEQIQRQNTCQENFAPVSHCAPEAGCPGAAECQRDTCCQPAVPYESPPTNDFPVAYPVPIQAPRPACAGSNQLPVCSCDIGCPQTTSCQPQIGCCPDGPRQPSIGISLPSIPRMPACPGGQPGIKRCGGYDRTECPSGYGCFNGVCCPMACPRGQNPTQFCGQQGGCPHQQSCYQPVQCCCQQEHVPTLPICPNGQTASQTCQRDAECGLHMECRNGGCCSMPFCPSGVQATARCILGAGCPQGCICLDGLCCPMPQCPNGQQATKMCTISNECGPGFECTNGGCCPLPRCPSGEMATSRCTGGDCCCPPGQSCQNGACCPQPLCPHGQPASGTCRGNFDCSPGHQCTNGGCCRLPTCPSGQMATQRCQAGAGCPPGQICQNGVCCPQPLCPNGYPTSGTCGGNFGCSAQHQCINGGCCPLPTCSTGQVATQRCHAGSRCPPNQICENGMCCPCPVCSNGQLAVQLCSPLGNSCPIGYNCEGGGCCSEPIHSCPNGGRAVQRCHTGSECPVGYGCTPLGSCCPLSLDRGCPTRHTPVCQCSPNNLCPAQASCQMGTCCASPQSTLNGHIVPGVGCQENQQCIGHQQHTAQCVQGICCCTQGAVSNGPSCVHRPQSLVHRARSACSQYGDPCQQSFLLSRARRRKPIDVSSIENNATNAQEPLWYQVATPRRCLTKPVGDVTDIDGTCLPNEKCIDGLCKLKLWPGEYGCTMDAECAARCPNTYCELNGRDKKVGQCRCTGAFLLYGRCFERCPRGFEENGAYCVHIDEEAFWRDANEEDRLKQLLNEDQC